MAPTNNLLLKIRGYLPSFNPALKKIADYILGNPHEVKLMRVKDLANRCGVSEATVIRFVHALGLTGFQEMKIILTEITSDKSPEKEFVYNDVTSGDSIDSIIKTILLNLNTTIQDTNALIEISDVKNAIEALRQAEKIDIYAAGSSYVSGEHARIRLYRIGKRCITYCDPSQQSVSASLLTQQDVAIGISNSGSTRATVRALGQAQESGATTICITNHELSPLTKFADIKLFTSTQNSAFFQQSMVSWVAQMLIIDVIYAGLAVKDFDIAVRRIQKSTTSLLNQHIDNIASL